MPYPQFDRHQIKMKPLSERINKKKIESDQVAPDQNPQPLTEQSRKVMMLAVERIRQARQNDRPVMLTFGAHTIKNGLAPVLIRLIEEKWITHLATNGAGIIHDWEFAYQGKSSEDVRANVAQGQFGNWQETGYWINLSLNVGAWRGLGYGESVGALIENEELKIPGANWLERDVEEYLHRQPEQAAAAADLLSIIRQFHLSAGELKVPHPYKQYSVQAAAYRLGVPFTGHPMIGHDIIYNHPMNHGGCLGRTALRDYLTFAESVSRIEGGVYLSLGSAVMSPMIFEKSLSMAQNLALQRGERIENHFMLIADLAQSSWDWSQGEPPEHHPDYYLRYNKTFHRMGGEMHYVSMDNRDFLLTLYQSLKTPAGQPAISG